MSWVDDNLSPGEAVLYRAKHKWTLLLQLRFLFPIFGQIGLLRSIVSLQRSEAVITTHRLVYLDQGIIGRKLYEINLRFVEGLSVKQGVRDRIANKGDIAIGTGSGNRDMEFYSVPDPMEFRRQALAAIDAESERLGAGAPTRRINHGNSEPYRSTDNSG